MVSLSKTSGGLYVTDDGTNINVYTSGTLRAKFRKSDNQLLLDAGVDSDAF